MTQEVGAFALRSPQRTISRLLSKTGLALAFGACALAAPAAWAGWNSSEEAVQANHPTWIYTPASTMNNGKRALMVVLHGCDQSHTQLKNWGNLAPAADQRGVVVAVPWVGKSPWPTVPSVNCWNYDGARDGSNHVAELEALVKTLKDRSNLNIDPRHIYVTGLSSGASIAINLACKAPDLIAGVGAIAGPSLGSSQMDATKDGGAILYTPEAARDKCRQLAGNAKLPFLDTQIANIAYGEKDKNGENPGCSYGAGNTTCPGTFQLVSKKWSTINAEMYRQLYQAGPLGAASLVAGSTGRESAAVKNGKPVVALASILNVGHAWPAGSGQANDASKGGIWMAQTGMNYGDYVINWFMANNRRLGQLTCAATGSDTDQATVGADAADGTSYSYKVALRGPTPVDDAAAGSGTSFKKTYTGLANGSYVATVTATGNAGNTTTCESGFRVGSTPMQAPVVSMKSASDSAITIEWPALEGAVGYQVTQTGGGSTVSKSVGASTGTVSFTATGLQAETTYSFVVQGVYQNNVAGPESNQVFGTTKYKCTQHYTSNAMHVSAGRAVAEGVYARAKGSNQLLGWNSNWVWTMLAQTQKGQFTLGYCPAN